MAVVEHVCCFALKQVGIDGLDAITKMVSDQFSDKGKLLVRALDRANRTAWKALEVSLTGETLWTRITHRTTEKAFREQIRRFLDQMPLPELSDKHQYRQACLKDLRGALGKGILFGEVVPAALLEKAGPMIGYADPQHVLKLEKQALHQLAFELQRGGFQALAWLLSQPARAADSVIVVGVRYFFRREVETNPELARSLQLTALEDLGESQREAFHGLSEALAQHGQHLEETLLEAQQLILAAIADVKAVIVAQGEQVQGRLEGMEQTLAGMQSKMDELLNRLGMLSQPVRAGHSLSIRNDREKHEVKEFQHTFHQLPQQVRDGQPGLVSKMGKLLLAAGEFDVAGQYFQQAARVARDQQDRAEAHHNAYRAQLEQKQYDNALSELLKASALDPERFAPFPQDRYEPLGILGAGGFGVTFLCRHAVSRGKVAVKSLTVEELDRDGATVVQEATTLEQLKHPALIGIRDCGFADREKHRPYLVMEYFDGPTLEQHVARNGSLPLDEALALARILAAGLQAAHAKNLLHRDVKPANVLVRKESGTWEVRIIDFGLALRQDLLTAAGSYSGGKSIAGGEIAGTIDYAAPEQMGKLPGVRVGPPTDVYGFGRTLNYALFGVPEATYHQYKKLPGPVAEFLSHCVQHKPADRPQSFAEVLTMLNGLTATAAVAVAAVEAEPILTATIIDDAPATRQERPRRRRPDEDEYDRPQKIRTTTATRIVHALLAFCFGTFGVHKFVQDNNSAGVARLLVCLTCIGIYVNAIVGMIEAIKYLTLSNEDYERAYYIEKRGWF